MIAVDGGYQYTYNIVLSADQGLSTSAPDPTSGMRFGSALTIFDFAGYVAGSATVTFDTLADPGGSFTLSTPLTTDTTFMATTPGERDSATIPNLTLTYAGPDFRTLSGTAGMSDFSDIVIATVTAVSTYSSTGFTTYSGIGVKNTGAATAGTAAFNAGTTVAPVAPTSTVPEAATWAMLVVGFGLVGSGLRSRRPNLAMTHFG